MPTFKARNPETVASSALTGLDNTSIKVAWQNVIASGLSLPDNASVVTQPAADNSTKPASTAHVKAAIAAGGGGGGGFTNPMTAQGDLIQGGASGAATRLPKGTNGQILAMVSGAPAWAAPAAADPLRGAVNVRDYGALGNNSADDTAAFQAAMSALTNGTNRPYGGCLYIPSGMYRITVSLDFTSMYGKGISIIGDGGAASTIVQMSNNLPIIILPGMHNMLVRDLQLMYNTQQTSSNTNSMCIQGSLGLYESGFYNSTFENLILEKGWIGIGAKQETPLIGPIWGNYMNRIWFNSIAGSAIYFNSPAGQPNHRFNNLYVLSSNMQNTMFVLGASDGTEFYNTEVNGWSGCPLIDMAGGGSLTVSGWRVEAGTLNYTGGSLRYLFNLQNAFSVTFDRFAIQGVTIAQTNNNVYLFNLVNCRYFHANSLHFWNTHNGGSGTLWGIGADSSSGPITVETVEGPSSVVPNFSLVNNGASVVGNYVTWNQQPKNRVVMGGDENTTLTLNHAENWVFTTLSTNRTVTLPNGDSFPNGIVNGMGFRISKPNTTTGNLVIAKPGPTTLYTIPAAKTGWVEFRYARLSAGWQMVGFYTSP